MVAERGRLEGPGGALAERSSEGASAAARFLPLLSREGSLMVRAGAVTG